MKILTSFFLYSVPFNNKKMKNEKEFDLVFWQLIKESGIDLLSIPPVRLDKNEEVTYEAATTAVKKALRLNLALQASDGHWPAENASPMILTPPLVCSSRKNLIKFFIE